MRFLVDLMCGGIVSYLRMCGHDTVYAGDRGVEADERIRELARDEDRTIVTRDVVLAECAERAILLRSRDVEEQLSTLAAAGATLELKREPTYCGACNGPLKRVDESETTPEYAPNASKMAVWRCRECNQHFWNGSHWTASAGRFRASTRTVTIRAKRGEITVDEKQARQ